MLKRANTLGRCTAMMLVALWAAQPLGALVHAEAHPHRFCPEHRTFEEASRGTGELLSQRSEHAPTVSSRAAAAADSTRSAHEECPLLSASTRTEVLTSEAMAVPAPCLSESHPSTAPPLRAHVSLPILATAPKSSPPARA
ncbi:hypothetical protein P2318_21365 [Myxococcaceae bacterium GXIMD 01537]